MVVFFGGTGRHITPVLPLLPVPSSLCSQGICQR